MNKVLGTCTCPLPWCKEPGAEVRESEKGGSPYLICDACNSMIRTTSRKGKAALRALVPAAPPPADPKPKAKEADPEPAPAPKRKGLGLGFV